MPILGMPITSLQGNQATCGYYGQPNGQRFGLDSEWLGGVFGQTHQSLW
jgi:hypothetical protein